MQCVDCETGRPGCPVQLVVRGRRIDGRTVTLKMEFVYFEWDSLRWMPR